ncbi:MAG: NAD-dependent epimerase/dehydratase family protein [Spirochaetales bacterium]|nr:NAD-dependent epimerase/dehydratase family protein [Spirochaetales bacterium]
MKVLILGGTGVISRAITENLLAGGYDVTHFNRGTKSVPFTKAVRLISGDRSKPGELEKAAGAEKFDAVIDMICFNKKDAEETIRAFRGKTGHIIITSSVAAYKRPYHSLPIREDAEELFTDPSFGYAFHKAELERFLWDLIGKEKLPVSILRPSLTFGVGAPNIGVLRQNYGVIERIRKGKPVVMFADGSCPWSFTFAEDLAKAYAALLGNTRAYGQAFHATSDELCRWEDLYLEFGRLAGAEPKIIHISSELLMKAAPNLCAHLYYEKTFPGIFDNTKIRCAAPSFKTTISLRQGCKTLFDWWEKEARAVDPEKDKLEDDLARAYEKFAESVTNIYTK